MGELESAVMDVLWDHGGFLTPGEVHRVLSAKRPLAYTTIMTILVRLWEKGRLERQRDRRAYAYRPVQTREEHAAARMQEMLAKAGDQPKALNYFVEVLRPTERDQLRRMLQGRKRGT
jgi:predicted transcriptional regulator